MQEILNKNILFCQHCFDSIEDDKFLCPACGLAYHESCWEKNYGCAVISCSQRNILLNPLYQSSVPVREILIHIEYLFNLKKYEEALEECERILNVDKSNTDAKIFFNKTKTIITIKSGILSDAETSYKKGELKAAALFYKQYKEYCPDDEIKVIDNKIEYITRLLPQYKRKRILRNIILTIISVLLFLAAGFIYYYNVMLKEDREYASISAFDNTDNIMALENQINSYESFLLKYPEGKYKQQAANKINTYSLLIAERISTGDWRLAHRFLKKVNGKDNLIAYNSVYKKIYETAEKEYNENMKAAKKFNKEKKFSQSKNIIEKNILITDYFSDTEIFDDRSKLIDNKNLLFKKISYDAKSKNIEKEITENESRLKSIDPSINPENIEAISGKIIKEIKDGYILKSLNSGKLYFIISANTYSKGEDVYLDCIREGKQNITDESGNEILLPAFKEIKINPLLQNISGKDLILQRLRYLREQKAKTDSILNLPL